jgi:hypothetical protein
LFLHLQQFMTDLMLFIHNKNAHQEQTYIYFPLALIAQTHSRQVTFIHMFNHLNYSTGSDQIGYCRLSSKCDLLSALSITTPGSYGSPTSLHKTYQKYMNVRALIDVSSV